MSNQFSVLHETCREHFWALVQAFGVLQARIKQRQASRPFQLVSVCSWAACLSVPGTTVLKAPGSPAHLCSRRQAQGVVASVNGPPFNKGYMPITEAHKAVSGRWAR